MLTEKPGLKSNDAFAPRAMVGNETFAGKVEIEPLDPVSDDITDAAAPPAFAEDAFGRFPLFSDCLGKFPGRTATGDPAAAAARFAVFGA